MDILIYGIGGKMGKVVYDCLKEEPHLRACCGVDKYLKENIYEVPVFAACNEVNIKADCIIDFSVHNGIYDYLPYAIKNRIPCVIATTGFDDEEQRYIYEASKSIPIFQSGNMSMGINLLIELVKKASQAIGNKAEIEIIEMHHNQKIDAPSGTAKMLAEAVKDELPCSKFVYGREGITGRRDKNEIGIHAVRGGSIVGKHSVMFIMNNEIVTLSHESENRSILARGSINAAEFIVGKKNGIYNMSDMLNK